MYRVFESVVLYCEAYSDLIPLSFVLGFYISIIMQRWWDQYSSIPWPDPIAVFVSSHIHGQVKKECTQKKTYLRNSNINPLVSYALYIKFCLSDNFLCSFKHIFFGQYFRRWFARGASIFVSAEDDDSLLQEIPKLK